MRVYLMRHGEAVSPDLVDRDDDRPLTPEGRASLRRSIELWAERLQAGEPAPSRWLVSPLVRAVQTYELSAAGLGSEAPIEVSRLIVPDGRISAAADWIEQQPEEAVALVGHQPLMGGLAAFLLGWSRVPAHLEPAAVLAVDWKPEGGSTLAWHLAPASDGKGPQLLTPPQ